jgi:NADH-quinone oxidoreductase subunit A
LFGLVEIIVFAGTVFFAFMYLIANGALDWGPIRRVRPVNEGVRTSYSTVRRISSSEEAA